MPVCHVIAPSGTTPYLPKIAVNDPLRLDKNGEGNKNKGTVDRPARRPTRSRMFSPNVIVGYITMFSVFTNSWTFARLLKLKTQAANSLLRRKTSRLLILLTPVMSPR